MEILFFNVMLLGQGEDSTLAVFHTMETMETDFPWDHS